MDTCHSDSQAGYELLSGTVIYQEGTYEDGSGNAKQEESALAELGEAGEGKVLRNRDHPGSKSGKTGCLGKEGNVYRIMWYVREDINILYCISIH